MKAKTDESGRCGEGVYGGGEARCWSSSASIDVEDLAKYFGPNRGESGPTRPRVSKNRDGRKLVKNWGDGCGFGNCEYAERCFAGDPGQLAPWNARPVNPGFFSIPCTEEQWLACDASHCSVYDSLADIRPNAPPPPPSARFHYQQNGCWYLAENTTDFGTPATAPCHFSSIGYDPSFCPASSYPPCFSPSETTEQQCYDDFLSNEKRKEKSRDAARCRRSRETDIFTDLARALPLSAKQAAHLDKASVMRLAIAYLKVRSVIDALEEPVVKCPSLPKIDADFPKALDGFMLVLSSNGDMVYLSDNVSDYLGVSQMEMMGQSVYEYSHPCDHDELRECLSIKPSDVKNNRACNFFLRLKCTLTSKGRKVNLKSASYKVIHCTGRAMGTYEPKIMKIDNESGSSLEDDSSESSSKEEDEDGAEIKNSMGLGYTGASLVIVGSPIPHPSNIEIPLGRQTFLSKHSLNMKFTYADERLAEYLGWASEELLGKSVFEFHHALDNLALDKSFKSLFSKGQCETMAYRFLNKNGGYAWVVTQATLIHCSKQHKPLSVVCVNHILSGVECEDEVYSERQLEARKARNASVKSPIDVKSVTAIEERPESSPLRKKTPILASSEDLTSDLEDQERLAVICDDRKKTRYPCPYKKDTLIPDNKNPNTAVVQNNIDNPSQDLPKELIARCKDWTFQGKNPLIYEAPRNNRVQSTTKNVFVPLGLTQDQELSQQQESQHTVSRPQTSTASIFAPRTEDMNKGFLTFSDDQPGLTMLKDEPEDLTHLAPTPGDVCVPLGETPFLSDMLDEFILSAENYCPLLNTVDLPNELPSSELGVSLTKGNNEICGSLESSLADSDPFIYRDMPSPCSLSPDLLSPSGLEKSPGQSSLSSLQSPKHNDLVDGMMSIGSNTPVGNPITEDDMLMLSINDVLEDEEMALRAPYIPMSDQDEALQSLINDDTVMWGPSQPPDKKARWHQEEIKPMSKSYEDSDLARLLKNDTGISKRNNNGGNLADPVQMFEQISTKGSNGASRLERGSKRVHAPISQSLESKRSRFNDSRLQIDESLVRDVTSILETSMRNGNALNYNEQSIDLLVNTNERNETNRYQNEASGSKLLLQQLMGREGLADGGGMSIMTKIRDTTTKEDLAGSLKIFTRNGATVAKPGIENKEKIGFAGDGGGLESRAKQRQTNSVLMNLLVSGCDKSPGLRTPQLSNKWSSMMGRQTMQSQLVGHNDSEMDFYDDYAISRDNLFSNYFNEDSTDLLSQNRYDLNASA